MSMQEDPSAKTFDPTPQKLLEARRKGEIAKSNDLFTAAAYAGLLFAFLLAGTSGIKVAGTAMMVLIDQPDHLAALFFDGRAEAPFAGLGRHVLIGFAPFFAFPALAVLGTVFAQRALVFAPNKLEPKLSRISLIANAKNKFGRAGLFEWAKSFTKLTVYSVCLALFIAARMPQMIAALRTDPNMVLSLMTRLCLAFLLVVVLIAALIGAIDAIWQHFEHLRKNRMSHKDIMDETKSNEGDPYLKQERRQRAMSIAQNRMMADVPSADVVIVNPTHYAVALKWTKETHTAPVCVAKGVDEIAHSIRERAQTAGVPIHRDPATARSLHATTEIGDEIAPDFYRAVAAAIRFAEDMRQRAKGRV